jgi:hypothetical protein
MDGSTRSPRRWAAMAVAASVAALAPIRPCPGQTQPSPSGRDRASGPSSASAAPLPERSLPGDGAAQLDPAVVRATFGHHEAYASPQQPYAPAQPQAMPAAAPQFPAVTQTVTPMTTLVPQAAAPMASAMVQVPVVYMPQAMSAPPSNFFLPSSAMGAQPMAAQPMAAQPMAAQPMAAVPMAVQPMAAQPMAAVAMAAQPMAAVPMAAQPMAAVAMGAQPAASAFGAITNQSISVPTSRSGTRVRVRGPGLLGSSLARFGERLTQFGRTRIETVSETELAAPLTQPSGGIATIQTAASTPLVAPQSATTTVPLQAQPQSAPPAPPLPTPQASPQSSHHHH